MYGQIPPGHFPHGENFNAHVIALGQKANTEGQGWNHHLMPFLFGKKSNL